MWKLNNINLNAFDLESNKTNNLSILKQNPFSLTNYGNICTILKDLILNTSEVIDNGDDTYSLILDEQPLIINSPEGVFTLAQNPDNPQNGEFIYINGKATIFSNSPITTVTHSSQSINLKTLRFYNIPSFLYNLPIQGGFSISENFQDLPSANFVFITTRKNINAYRDRFKNGTIIELYKYKFIINGFTEEIIPDTNEISISISLRGIQEMYINKSVLLNNNPKDSFSDFTDPDCQVNVQINNENNPEYISINTLAARAGTSISGITFKIKVPSDNSDSSTTNISTEINKYLDIKESFVDYNSGTIIVKNINNVNTWHFTEDGLISSFTTNINSIPYLPINNSSSLPEEINYNLNGLVPDSINITDTSSSISENYSNIPIPTLMNATTPNIFDNLGRVIPEEKTKSNEPKFKIRTVKRKIYSKGDPNPSTCPDNVLRLNSLTYNYDNGGTTKTQVITTEENGFPIQEITIKYGFAYLAKDIYYLNAEDEPILDAAPQDHWVIIETSYTNYNYDEDTGYLLGYDISGVRLLRYAIEPDTLPTIEYVSSGDPLDETDLLTYNSYKFENVPIYGIKKYLLYQHRDYYTNFQSEQKQIKKCLRDGSSIWIDNPTYVESMFAVAESEEKQCFSLMRNPRNVDREPTDPIYAPLITGEETINRSFITISPSQNTNPGFYRDTSLPTEDRYLSYVSNFSAQEPGFTTIVENTTINENSGIPNVHTKKTSKYELVEDKEEKPKEVATYRYVFWTAPFNGGYPREGNISFDAAKTFDEVLTGVKTQLKIQDIRNTLSSTVTIPINLDIRTGDICNFNINGLNYRRRVTSLTHNFIIDGIDENNSPILINEGTNLNLGIDRNINVQYKKEKIPKNKKYNNPNSNVVINENDLILGSLLPKKYRTRGNYYELPE